MVKACKVKMNIPSKKCPEFFKFYIPTYCSERLRIPPAFIAHLNGLIPDKVILRNRHGRLWHVEVGKIEDGHFFQNGWPGFVKDNYVEMGDFIVFRYNGNCVFDFKLFGKTQCEKEGTGVYVNIGNITSYIKEEVEEEEEEEEEDDDDDDDDDDEEEEEELKSKIIDKKTLGCKSQNYGRSWKNVYGNNNCGYKGTAAVKVEEDDTFEAQHFVPPKNPYFVTKIRPRRLNELYVPVDVIKDNNLKLKPRMILRDPSGKTWPTKVVIWQDGRTWLSGGWKAFCIWNKLGNKDRCICEFMRGRGRRGDLIQIHILRAASRMGRPPKPR